jgi:hypothetical protein
MQKTETVLADVGESLVSTSSKAGHKGLLLVHVLVSVSVLGADLALLVLCDVDRRDASARSSYASG